MTIRRTCFCKAAKSAKRVSVARDTAVASIPSPGFVRRLIRFISTLLGAASVLLIASTTSSAGVVNVYTATPALQQDFIAMTTSQYLGTLTASPYFAGSYSLTLTGKTFTGIPGTCPPPATLDQQLAIATTTLAALSTDYYLNGWANGMQYERYQNIQTMGYFAQCSTSAFVAPAGQSTSTWKVPKIDTTTCSFILGYVSNFVYQQNFSSPTIVPGY